MTLGGVMFKIEDELHAEFKDGEFGTLDAALTELRRRAQLPWDEPPNVAPCTSWRTCGRCYEVVEYDPSHAPWKELRRTPALEIDSAGARWLTNFPASVTS
jgi:hypothetical protein